LLIFTSLAIPFFKVVIKPLKLLGDISYSLYLTHPLVLIVFLGVAKRLSFETIRNQLLALFVEITVATLFAYLFYCVIEKPSSDLSKRFFYNKKRH
jgi:peptidoglycan/LPS O-acetylase OafA/YrhL